MPSYVWEAALIFTRSLLPKKRGHVPTSSAFMLSGMPSAEEVKGFGIFKVIFAEHGDVLVVVDELMVVGGPVIDVNGTGTGDFA